MIQIHSLEEGLPLFKALGSGVRFRIVELLARHESLSLNDLAASLGITGNAIIPHLKKLEEHGLITVIQDKESRDPQRRYSLQEVQLLLDIAPTRKDPSANIYEAAIPIGAYGACQVSPPCGFANPEGVLYQDKPELFITEAHEECRLLWFQHGWVSYSIPNKVPEGSQITQLTISLELSSTQYGKEDADKGEIAFYLNDHLLGTWITFEATGFERGLYTPAWWTGRSMQYGFLKMLVLNDSGVYLDGLKISDAALTQDFSLEEGAPIILKLECREGPYQGGMALYGTQFGDYRQDIMVRVHYS